MTVSNPLLKKLISKNAKGVTGSTVSDTDFFNTSNFTSTSIPALNVAMSGEIDGGLTSGLTILAGESKTFKSCMSLVFVAAYLNDNPDSVCVFYDSEFGTTKEYMESFDIDTERVIHVPVEHVEQLKFDIVTKLDEIKKGDKVIILVDSIGNIASKKEVDDANDEKSVADMSRAKAIKSLLRIITPKLLIKDIPCIAIGHTYKDMGLFPKTIVSGGNAILYSANTVLVITKRQEKDATGIKGFTFNITVEKSRYIREKAKIPLRVMYDDGIYKWSGFLDWAMESGHIVKPKNGWYCKVDPETGEMSEKNYREKDLAPVFKELIEEEVFRTFVSNRFKLSSNGIITEEIEDDV